MNNILSCIAFCMWERKIAEQLGITHGTMKDLMLMRAIPVGATYDEAKKAYDEWMKKHPNTYPSNWSFYV